MWSCLSEVSEAQSGALYKVTTPSKRPGLHKRTFYDSALQKNSFKSSKHTHRERQTVDGKFSAKPRVRQRMEAGETKSERDIKGKREENPQKQFDISHQRAMLTCLTLHFKLRAKSST